MANENTGQEAADMFYLVTGGSGSGKSAYAEDVVCGLAREASGSLLYIATMIPYGEETKRKIHRHRMMRKDKGFETMECYTGLEEKAGHDLEGNTVCGELSSRCILLECISNLAANEMYQPDGAGKHTAEAVIRGVRVLKEKCRHLVIVTNEVCSECTADSEEMRMYKQLMGEINAELACMADSVTEVVYGIPADLKPGKASGGADTKGRSTLLQCKMITEDKNTLRSDTKTDGKVKGGPRMKLVIGGAYQGKLAYAKKEFAKAGMSWTDGALCPFEDIYTCQAVWHFESFIRRMMAEGKDTKGLAASIAEKNPDIIIVSTEIGYGLVPVDAFAREYREQAGRVCTELAASASRVDRVVCGIGTTLKGE